MLTGSQSGPQIKVLSTFTGGVKLVFVAFAKFVFDLPGDKHTRLISNHSTFLFSQVHFSTWHWLAPGFAAPLTWPSLINSSFTITK